MKPAQYVAALEIIFFPVKSEMKKLTIFEQPSACERVDVAKAFEIRIFQERMKSATFSGGSKGEGSHGS